MKPFILGAVFARGGSKGIPGKNIKLLAGKPLIAYALEMGLSISAIDAMIVSTDDQTIAQTAKHYGAQVPFMRPAELATDHAAELLSWQHAIRTYQQQMRKTVDILVSIPTTAPLRQRADVEAVIDLLLKTDADVVMTACEAHRNPYFNMVTLDKEATASRVMGSSQPLVTRQTAQAVYDVTTVAYACRAKFILHHTGLFEGKVKVVLVPRERALDIDTPLDWEIAEFLMSRKGH